MRRADHSPRESYQMSKYVDKKFPMCDDPSRNVKPLCVYEISLYFCLVYTSVFHSFLCSLQTFLVFYFYTLKSYKEICRKYAETILLRVFVYVLIRLVYFTTLILWIYKVWGLLCDMNTYHFIGWCSMYWMYTNILEEHTASIISAETIIFYNIFHQFLNIFTILPSITF